MHTNNLKFNFGFLIETPPGTTGAFEFDYPNIIIEDEKFTPMTGDFTVTRTSEGILVQGKFNTTAMMECIRCLELSDVAVIGHIEELFFYPPSAALLKEDAFVMGEDGNVDLGLLIRQLALVDRPMQPLCKKDCEGFCMECGTNLNIEDCGCEEDDIDPRLAVLKNLLKDNK
ncbi:MAG: hypothetical protein ACI85U_001379 [Candidatus Promineifilaceae bacterium]|jgi:uncharacterized protein